MKMVQMLTHELGPKCNMAHLHGRCPINLRRTSSLPLMPDGVIVDNVHQAYAMGFQGMLAWHWYSEPLLYRERLEKLIGDIGVKQPHARHLLWTNGTLLIDCTPQFLTKFSKIVVSNYAKQDWKWLLRGLVPDVMVVSGTLDGRIAPGRVTHSRCLRPYHELILDCYGKFRLCCGDHQGTSSSLNLMTHGFPAIVEEYLRLRANVETDPLPANAPKVCFTCRVRGRDRVDDLVSEPFMATMEDLAR